MTAKSLRVAISGGGVAGASLMHALMLHKNIDAHIFEAAPEFREAGLAIGIARQAQEALELIGPSAIDALHRSGAVVSNGTWFMIGAGPDAGFEIDKLDVKEIGERLESITQRSDFLGRLLDSVPAQRMHASKKLTEIHQQGEDGELVLKFTDGTVHECDVLIGADGMRSSVRKYILGETDPAANPRNAGFYVLWMMRPYDQARRLLGEDWIDRANHREIVWLTDGSCILHNISGNGELVQFAAVVWDSNNVGGQDWMRNVDVEAEKKKFSKWPPRFQKALSEFLDEEPEPKAIHLWEHPHARTYVKGTVAVMGDAAHGTTPWQASGGGMSIEDALILSTLLSRSKSRSEAAIALQVYEEVRLPRTQKIVDSSRETGVTCMGGSPDLGKIGPHMKGKLRSRWDHIHYFDNAKSRDEAVKKFDERVRE